MEDEAPVVTPEDVPVAVGGDAQISAREAGRLLASFRHSKPQEQPEPSPLVAEVAQAESGEQPVEAAPETDPGEQPQAEEPAEELPPIDPPRSWSREWKEEFQTYPRDLQEKISAREQERETALRRGQNEAAEQRKAAEAQREQMEQSRKQYEQAIFQASQILQSQSGEFADIKTWQDVQKLASEDWPRYAKWDAWYKQSQVIAQEAQAAQQRQQNEYQQQWSKFSSDEDAKFIERAPEMADTATAAKIRDASVSYLQDLGFSEEELGKMWSGQAHPPLRDHRMQLLIRDAVRYREAKAAVPKAAVKPIPKVQRPGSPAQRVPDADAQQRALYQRIDETRGLAAARLGAQLIAQRRAGR